MSINRTEVAFGKMTIFVKLTHFKLKTSQISNKNQLKPLFTGLWLSDPLRAIKSKVLLFTIIIIVPLIYLSLCDDFKY